MSTSRDRADRDLDVPERRGRPLWQAIVAVAVLALVGGALFVAADRFASFEVARHDERDSRPRVDRTLPVDGDVVPAGRREFRAELFLPVVGVGVDAATATPASVRLVDVESGEPLAANLTVAADGASVSLTPIEPLVAGSSVRFEISAELTDGAGNAFIPYVSFVRVGEATDVGAGEAGGIAYERVGTAAEFGESLVTAMTWGPGEGEGGTTLYVGTADGRVVRYAVGDGELPRELGVVTSVLQANGGPRLISGLAFAADGTLWVSHMTLGFEGQDDFTGKLSTLSGDGLATYSDRVVGLPRAYKDHGNFGIVFDPRDPDILYLSQGSNTGHGGRDSKWNYRPERELTAAMLKVDVGQLPTDGPLDVATPVEADSPFDGGSYDPSSPGAAVTVHATGIRSGYQPLFHSSGKLLVAINGATAGGNAPPLRDEGGRVVEGPLLSVGQTTPDTLADLTAGGYHGHPNPFRGEDVLMGGNPTEGRDPYEIKDYPVGVDAEPTFSLPLFNFGGGYSVNGLSESRADVFDGAIRGDVFAARYSAGDDVILLDFDENGEVIAMRTGIPGLVGLESPLLVLEDAATGWLYIAEADANRLSVFKPISRN